jgi:hypothetical protein
MDPHEKQQEDDEGTGPPRCRPSAAHEVPKAQGAEAALSAYDRATVGLWARSYREVHGGAGPRPAPAPAGQPLPGYLAAAAVHALLVGLRRCAEPAALFALYADTAATAADFALVDSLVPPAMADAADPRHLNDERRWQVRDAAFHVRWLELTWTPGRGTG